MQPWTNELKVGLFVVICVALLAGGYALTWDGVRADESSYSLVVYTGNADGLWRGSAVRLAGVEIGSVDTISLEDGRAKLILHVRSQYELPADSVAQLKASGMLGDKYIGIGLGEEASMLSDGDTLPVAPAPGDMDALFVRADEISDDVKAITAAVRALLAKEETTDQIDRTLANMAAFTEEMHLMVSENRQGLRALVQSMRATSEDLRALSGRLGPGAEEELAAIREATAKLDAALENVESITAKIDDGEGTLGGLLNERTTLDSLNSALDQANETLGALPSLQVSPYYSGRVYLGSQPGGSGPFAGSNPLTPTPAGALGVGAAHSLGIDVAPKPDRWLTVGLTDHPQGHVLQTDTTTGESEWTREDRLRWTALVNKRWGGVAARGGFRESTLGVGLTGYLADDRFQLAADVFDFRSGAFPDQARAGLPNMRVAARVAPWEAFAFEVGTEQPLLGAAAGFATGFAGIEARLPDPDPDR
ncbi:MAG: phospholipid/cholesterol/gamma-HCH transport system substrate-binding protein [Myxococcota bacterium]